MNRDDIIRMAREAGSIDSEEVIQTVWNAFAAAEREACAKTVEIFDKTFQTGGGIAGSIRARGDKC